LSHNRIEANHAPTFALFVICPYSLGPTLALFVPTTPPLLSFFAFTDSQLTML